MCLMSYANNKGADQPAHPCSLFSAFVVHCLDSIISLRFYSRNFKSLASFCGCADRFMSGLIGKSQKHVCRDEAQLYSILLASSLPPPFYDAVGRWRQYVVVLYCSRTANNQTVDSGRLSHICRQLSYICRQW